MNYCYIETRYDKLLRNVCLIELSEFNSGYHFSLVMKICKTLVH